MLAESTASQFPHSVEILPLFSQCPGELCAGASPSLQAACWQKQPPASGVLRYEQCSDVLSKIRKQVACSLCSFVIWSCIFVLSFFFFFFLLDCLFCLLAFIFALSLFIFSSVWVWFFVCVRWGAGRGRQCPFDALLSEGEAGMSNLEPSSPASKTGFPPPSAVRFGLPRARSGQCESPAASPSWLRDPPGVLQHPNQRC